MNRINKLKQSIKDCKKAIKEYKETIKQLESDTVLEVGRWYKSEMDGLWLIESISNDTQVSYGLNC